MERFHYYDAKLKIAHGMGYRTITEAIKFEYRRLKSASKVGYLFGMTNKGIQSALRRMGEPLIGRGGFHEGDIRRGRQSRYEYPKELKPNTDSWTKAPSHRKKVFHQSTQPEK